MVPLYPAPEDFLIQSPHHWAAVSTSPSVSVDGQQGRCHPLGCLTASPGLKGSWAVCAIDFSGANPADTLSYKSTLYFTLSCSSESHLVGKYVMSLQFVSFSSSILSFFSFFSCVWIHSSISPLTFWFFPTSAIYCLIYNLLLLETLVVVTAWWVTRSTMGSNSVTVADPLCFLSFFLQP